MNCYAGVHCGACFVSPAIVIALALLRLKGDSAWLILAGGLIGLVVHLLS